MKIAIKLIKTVIFLTIIIVLGYMAYLHRDFLWNQTKMARAFYYVYKGDEALKQHDFQNAIDNYKQGLKMYPEHSKAHYNLGNIYFSYELYTAPAEKAPIKVFKYDEKQKIFVLFVDTKTEEEDSESNAEAAYIKATEVNPDYINAWVNLGRVKEEKKDYEGAIIAYTKAINANPMIIKIPFIFNNEENIKYNRAIAYYNLGHIYSQKAQGTDYEDLKEHDYVEALRYYNKSNEIYPYNYSTAYNMGRSNQVLGRSTSAINSYCKAIKIKPLRFEAHYNLGVLLKEEQRYLAAADELKKAAILTVDSNNITPRDYLFRILNDTSLRAAAVALSEMAETKQTTYPYPKTGIVADYVVKPYMEQQELIEKEKLALEATKKPETSEQQKNSTGDGDSKQSSVMDQTEKEFASCVVDLDYAQDQKDKYLKHPQWINVGNELFVPEIKEEYYYYD